MSYTNFQVGEKFPLPIQAAGDGGLFQIDANGMMFILQLSNTDVIATEAFRTGKMELALYEEDGLLFFLYQIDGIFKTGWGDAPLALHRLPPELQPDPEKLTDPTLHLYLVDSRLQLLLALRQVPLPADFFGRLHDYVASHQQAPLPADEFQRRLQSIWQRLTPAGMREQATAVLEVPLAIEPLRPLH